MERARTRKKKKQDEGKLSLGSFISKGRKAKKRRSAGVWWEGQDAMVFSLHLKKHFCPISDSVSYLLRILAARQKEKEEGREGADGEKERESAPCEEYSW